MHVVLATGQIDSMTDLELRLLDVLLVDPGRRTQLALNADLRALRDLCSNTLCHGAPYVNFVPVGQTNW